MRARPHNSTTVGGTSRRSEQAVVNRPDGDLEALGLRLRAHDAQGSAPTDSVLVGETSSPEHPERVFPPGSLPRGLQGGPQDIPPATPINRRRLVITIIVVILTLTGGTWGAVLAERGEMGFSGETYSFVAGFLWGIVMTALLIVLSLLAGAAIRELWPELRKMFTDWLYNREDEGSQCS